MKRLFLMVFLLVTASASAFNVRQFRLVTTGDNETNWVVGAGHLVISNATVTAIGNDLYVVTEGGEGGGGGGLTNVWYADGAMFNTNHIFELATSDSELLSITPSVVSGRTKFLLTPNATIPTNITVNAGSVAWNASTHTFEITMPPQGGGATGQWYLAAALFGVSDQLELTNTTPGYMTITGFTNAAGKAFYQFALNSAIISNNWPGTITANAFSGAHSGSGTGLTALPGAQITGTIPVSVLPGQTPTNLFITAGQGYVLWDAVNRIFTLQITNLAGEANGPLLNTTVDAIRGSGTIAGSWAEGKTLLYTGGQLVITNATELPPSSQTKTNDTLFITARGAGIWGNSTMTRDVPYGTSLLVGQNGTNDHAQWLLPIPSRFRSSGTTRLKTFWTTPAPGLATGLVEIAVLPYVVGDTLAITNAAYATAEIYTNSTVQVTGTPPVYASSDWTSLAGATNWTAGGAVLIRLRYLAGPTNAFLRGELEHDLQ